MFEMDLHPRLSETDGAGHIGNTVLVVWFEEARTPLYQIVMPELSMDTWSLILANYSVDFYAQIFYGTPVQLKTWVKRVGNSSFETYQEVWQNGKRCASGTSVQVYFNYQTGKSEPIPDKIKAGLTEHLLPGQDKV